MVLTPAPARFRGFDECADGFVLREFHHTGVCSYSRTVEERLRSRRVADDLQVAKGIAHPIHRACLCAEMPVVFTLRVTNVGPQTANGVYLNAPLPVDAQFLSATASQGGWSFTNGVFAAELGTVASAGSATVTITVSFSIGGGHTSTATVSAVGLNANSADNAVAAVVNITVLPTLTIRLGATNVVLSWPTNSMGFGLERTSDLTPPSTWNPAVTNRRRWAIISSFRFR